MCWLVQVVRKERPRRAFLFFTTTTPASQCVQCMAETGLDGRSIRAVTLVHHLPSATKPFRVLIGQKRKEVHRRCFPATCCGFSALFVSTTLRDLETRRRALVRTRVRCPSSHDAPVCCSSLHMTRRCGGAAEADMPDMGHGYTFRSVIVLAINDSNTSAGNFNGQPVSQTSPWQRGVLLARSPISSPLAAWG